jgi:hypothetical protein
MNICSENKNEDGSLRNFNMISLAGEKLVRATKEKTSVENDIQTFAKKIL